MSKVFVVTSGSYSSYHIEAVFSSRYKARKFLDYVGDSKIYDFGDYRIETYETDRPVWEIVPMFVRMDMSGNVGEAAPAGYSHEIGFICFDVEDNLVWSVPTKDKQAAIKATNEARMLLLALNLWGRASMKAVRKAIRADRLQPTSKSSIDA